MFLAERGLPNLWLVVATLIGGAAAAASASVFNCIADRDIDAKMRRTENRPLVTGEITPRAATIFAFALGFGSIFWLGGFTNWVAAGLTAIAILLYAVFYTLVLKRRTTQNIVWGGAAGCMPVLIGWSAVTGSLSWEPLLLFLVVFFWTLPHYWPLAIKYKADYEAADVPMLPNKVPPTKIAKQMIWYTVAMLAASFALIAVAPMGPVYIIASVAAGAWFLLGVHRLHQAREGRAVRYTTACDARLPRIDHLPVRALPRSGDRPVPQPLGLMRTSPAGTRSPRSRTLRPRGDVFSVAGSSGGCGLRGVVGAELDTVLAGEPRFALHGRGG